TTRAEGIFALSSDTFRLSPSVFLSASAGVRFDAYGTAQQRTIIQGTTALTTIVTPHDYVAFSYINTSVNGTSPFQFDLITPDSAVTLSYGHSSTGFLPAIGGLLSYDFYSRQTT